MRSIFWLGMLAMAMALTGCHTDTCDGRGPSDICQVHHEYMQAELVRNRHPNMPSQDYLMARGQFFPHTYPFALPDQCKKCMVYICDDCVKAEKAWKRDHPEEK